MSLAEAEASSRASAVEAWLKAWEEAPSPSELSSLFHEGGLWRDYLAFCGDLRTVEGREGIARFAEARAGGARPESVRLERSASPTEALFRFESGMGSCRGLVRLRDGRCETLFTSLEKLSLDAAGRAPTQGEGEGDAFALIVGGGQSGLALGARLKRAGVPCLIVERSPRIGDCWRNRYDSLTLHDPVWVNHLPCKRFPPEWPTFTPKDMMADWLESYADEMGLAVRTGASCERAAFLPGERRWEVELASEGGSETLKPRHLVMAVGNSGFPKIPAFDGADAFRGEQMHSSAYLNGEAFRGKKVAVIGAGNSAHDIACDLVRCGAHPTLVQRSSTHVVPQRVYVDEMLGAYYSPDGEGDVEDGDFLAASIPLREFERRQIGLWSRVKERERDFYRSLAEVGFKLDFAEDGAGMGAKYRRSASGYYIDTGGVELVANGRIAVRSGVEVESLERNGLRLDSGETLPADAIVYATGFGSMEDWVSRIIGPETAEKIGRCWGYGSGFKGDPGPWEGELRNMWKPTAQEGLWFMGGNLAQARFHSRYLSLQLAARFFGLEDRFAPA